MVLDQIFCKLFIFLYKLEMQSLFIGLKYRGKVLKGLQFRSFELFQGVLLLSSEITHTLDT